MIKTFKCKHTEALFYEGYSKKFANIEIVATRKLLMLHAAGRLEALRAPPSNQLEFLKGDRLGQYSIRINKQFRLCFVWTDDGVYDVEIIDYH